MPTLTSEQVARALNHLRSEYPEPMSALEREDYYDVLTHLHPGELSQALSKMSADRRPPPDALLRAVMEARPASLPGPRTRGGKPGKAAPEFVYGVIELARQDLARVREAG